MKQYHLIILLIISSVIACQDKAGEPLSEAGIWKLGWRMIASSMEEQYELAELQFDSLLAATDNIDRKFLVTGLEIKYKLGKKEELLEVLTGQEEEMLRAICPKPFLANLAPCAGLSEEEVTNPVLQMELIRMYVDDQAARGNRMEEIVEKYQLDTAQITRDGAVGIDLRNRERLREIFQEYGFPTRIMVGRDAMFGVFLMIQHADGDKTWQESQLKNIEKAVQDGDVDGQAYAYLYDRIKINKGEKQRYGTQFAKVDPVSKIVELADTEDPDSLDERRRAIGMMPVEMYKRMMLKNL